MRTLALLTLTTQMEPEGCSCLDLMDQVVLPHRVSTTEAEPPVVRGILPEVVTGLVDKFLLVAALLAVVDCRFFGCWIWYMTGFLQLAEVVWGLEGETTQPLTSQDSESTDSLDDASETSVRAVLWVSVFIIVAVLTLCYRFEMWHVFFAGECKYTLLSRCHQYETIASSRQLAEIQHRTEVQHLTEVQYPAEIQHPSEIQHPGEIQYPAEIQHPSEIQHPGESKCPIKIEHPTQGNCAGPGQAYPDLNIRDFLEHVKTLQLDGGCGFSHQFLKLADAARDKSILSDHSCLPNNVYKNRYKNITAYDHSRVILGTTKTGQDQSDYINANYIHGYKKAQTYIATQGPLPQTVVDFWIMVWEQNTNVIVMITNLTEKGVIKCEQYWPFTGETVFGDLTVRLVSTDCRAFYIVTVLGVKLNGGNHATERTVYHYHYTQWPDHGVPDYSLSVLSFVQKSAAQSGPDNGPIIVHCSAGVGRTGTYIVIDSMIEQIKDKQSVNIAGCIQDIRTQRNFLVQTEGQFRFIHEVLVEYLWVNGTTEVRETRMLDYLMELEQPFSSKFLSPISQASLLEKQFEQVSKYTPKQCELSAALAFINQSKNRAGSILPVNSSRVLLPVNPDLASSDYINATFLQGYRKASEFIVTQHPMADTMVDFWRMVWHEQSPAIVVLSPLNDQDYTEFWPNDGASLYSEGLTVTCRGEPLSVTTQGWRIIDVVVSFYKSDTLLLTRIMMNNDWTGHYSKLYRMFDPISAAHAYLTTLPECGPVTVVDRFGGVEAGTFCALWTLRDQMLCERCADFYQVCKLYHYKRPGIFRSQGDYLLLHHAVAALCEHLQDQHRDHKHDDHIYSNQIFSSSKIAIICSQEESVDGTTSRSRGSETPAAGLKNGCSNISLKTRQEDLDGGM